MMYDHTEEMSVITQSSSGRHYKKRITLKYKGDKIHIFSPYDKYLIGEFKVMEGAKWLGFEKPPIKAWAIKNSVRNHFALSFLRGENPYAGYQLPLDPWIKKITGSLVDGRPLYEHQVAMTAQICAKHYTIIAGEMGTGKTLAMIEAAERSGIKANNLFDTEMLYVGPKSGVVAVGREFSKWGSPLRPRMMTYEKLVSSQSNAHYPLKPGMIPRFVCYDESSKIKNPNAKRSQAALALAELVRDTHGQNGFVVLMSGTPAPRVPVDWWYQAEVTCPGYIREGSIHQFKKRLCVVEERESVAGGVYPHIVTWLDDESKCQTCGMFKSDPKHNQVAALTQGMSYHDFVPSRNEVQYLYERLKGLVLIKMKKDCLDLPEKQYQVIELKPTVEIIRKANMITRNSGRAITALSLLRELSDGFQYFEKEVGESTCPMCNGNKTVAKTKVDILAEDFDNENYGMVFDEDGSGEHINHDHDVVIKQGSFDPESNDPESNDPDSSDEPSDESSDERISCPQCGGTGVIKRYQRDANRITTPKDEALNDVLDDMEDVGRIVIWGGFTETIDKICESCYQKGWGTLRVDGRGYRVQTPLGDTVHQNTFLDAMDGSHPNKLELYEKYPKVAFVGHPKAGGMALTLTASPIALYYSNTFDGEARMQSEDRIHRPGMDTNRGATIIDMIHLPTDKMILENLRKKKRLQGLTMGEVAEAMSGLMDGQGR
jgi:ssDNA-binding Zn-finger/Zn-ribbon topoisomerase 1